MSALVAPSGECLRCDGRCADRISLFARAKPCRWLCLACVPWCIALSCVSTVVLCIVSCLNTKVDDDDDDHHHHHEISSASFCYITSLLSSIFIL